MTVLRTPEEIEATGHKSICVPRMEQLPGCAHHDHMPGEPIDPPPPVEGGVRQVQRPPIPFARVQQLVTALLGDVELHDVRGVTVHPKAVEVELYARDADGRRYARGHGARAEVAVDVIHFPVVP